VCVAPSIALAQADSLQVINTLGDAVPYASVNVGGGKTRVTNAGASVGVVARRIRYESFQGSVNRAGGNGLFVVALAPTPAFGKKGVVNARANEVLLERTGFYLRMREAERGSVTAEFFTPEDMSLRANGRVSHVLYASRFAHIQQFNIRMPPRGIATGRMGCAMALVVDGVRVSPLLGDSNATISASNEAQADQFYSGRPSLDEEVRGDEVPAIEIYPSLSNAPAAVQTRVVGTACGVVLVWTGAKLSVAKAFMESAPATGACSRDASTEKREHKATTMSHAKNASCLCSCTRNRCRLILPAASTPLLE
jgi:hypothetical protein